MGIKLKRVRLEKKVAQRALQEAATRKRQEGKKV